jgi:hypothetical protein
MFTTECSKPSGEAHGESIASEIPKQLYQSVPFDF